MSREAAWTLGVEEEYQIVDPTTRELRPRSTEVLPQAEPALGQDVQPERFPTIEFRVTDVCLTVDEAGMAAGLADR